VRALVRLALFPAMLLLSGGTAIAPHEDPGKPPLHVNHPPTASRLVLLGHLHLERTEAPRVAAGGTAIHPDHPASSLAEADARALIGARPSRLWRPSPDGIEAVGADIPSPRWHTRTRHGPPRSSLVV
jgi:hypothetical protein